MSALTSQLVWLLISYLGTKLASKGWGTVALNTFRQRTGDSPSELLLRKLAGVPAMDEAMRERLTADERELIERLRTGRSGRGD